jgi:hypothetical protein
MAGGDAYIADLRTEAPAGARGRHGRDPLAAVRRLSSADRWVLAALGLLFVAFAALTWKTWGSPQSDYGVELTTADRLAHGASLYDDVRYFYGPLGVYPLGLAFKLFGTSFTTAFAFGLLQALAIFASFHALARTWLTPAFAGAATAIVIAIGFTGTLFGYVAPHTTSATFGMLAILLQLLALTRGRLVLAGVATGAALLTRPELAAVAVAIGAGFLIGRLLESNRRAALRDLALLSGPALAIALAVLGPFAIAVGPGNLFFDQLIPLDMLRIAGLKFQASWAPFDLISAISLGLRGLVFGVLLVAVAAASVLWSRRPGARALIPLLIGIGGLLALDAAAHVIGIFPGTIGVVQTEAKRLLLGMSWLPLTVVVVAFWAAVRARQGLLPPISGRWSLDLALLFGSAVLAARAYNNFTTDTYAAYYAPPLVLLAAVICQGIAKRFPGARAGLLLALGAVFAGMAWNAVGTGPTREDEFDLHTARGTYLMPAHTGPNYQRLLDTVRADSAPGEPILALPLEGGLPFAADRPPALPELQFHPGVVDSRADEREALATLEARDVPLVVEGNARFDEWGLPVIGIDYDRLLIGQIKRRYSRVKEIGDYSDAPPGRIFARAFRVYELPARPSRQQP